MLEIPNHSIAARILYQIVLNGIECSLRRAMNRSISKWLMFAALLLLAPVPYFLAEMGRVPPARLFQLAGYLIALVVSEGGQGAVLQAVLLLVTQASAYAIAAFFLADALARPLARLRPRAAPVVTISLIACAVVCSLLMRPYSTPFSVQASKNGLSGVYR